MKKVFLIGVVLFALWANSALAHNIYIKKNPTNENGLEFGVDNASGFTKWRAYVKGQSNNSQGQNSGWTYASGWWYYDVSSLSSRVMWRVTGLENQKFTITYWVFKSDGTWEYGSQVEVISDTTAPSASFSSPTNNSTFNQATFSIFASGSDNLSGVEAIRIYAEVPSGNSLSGWTASGLASQYYLEFSGSTASYNFTAPASGSYTFTLWVKDKAGNITYEPGGPINVAVNLPSSQKYACDTTNGTCSASSSGAYSSQGDCEDSCVKVIVSKYACNTTNGTCSSSSSGSYSSQGDCESSCVKIQKYACNTTNGTCSASSSGAFSNLSDCQSSCAAPRYTCDTLTGTCSVATLGLYSSLSDCQSGCTLATTDDYKYADHFIYPLKCEKIYRVDKDANIPAGACFDYQPFGSLFSYTDKIHLGADLNLKGVDDLGALEYAVANALIYDFGWTSGWGNFLILQVTAKSGISFFLPNGQKVSQLYFLYGHLNEIKVIKGDGTILTQAQLVKKSTYVKIGEQVGTVGDGNGNFSPHLHFEARQNYSQLGPGYWPLGDYATYQKYWFDPIEFIENNMASVSAKPLTLYIHAYDLDSSQSARVELDISIWQRQGRVSDGAPLSAIGWNNYTWLISTAQDKAASWHFDVPAGGAYSLYAVIPRYYATSQKVRYRIWHSRANVTNPAWLTVDQSNANTDKFIYLGTYDYVAGWNYSVDLFSQTSESPAKVAAFDTLILVYEGDFGSGGGSLPPTLGQSVCGNGVCEESEDEQICSADCQSGSSVDQAPTIKSLGKLTFVYEGDFASPKLYCYGAGLENYNPILANGVTAKTVSVQDSATVYCNVKFEDGSWLASSAGILKGQKLLVNKKEIKYIADNNSGGKSLVFNLLVKSSSGGGNENNSGDDSVGGCQVSMQSENAATSLGNMAIILCPLLLPFGRRLFKNS